jgi:hypothetical protein
MLQVPPMSGDNPNTSLNVRSAKEYFETVGKSGRSPREETEKPTESSPNSVKAKVAHYLALQQKQTGQSRDSIEEDDGVSSKIRAYERKIKGVPTRSKGRSVAKTSQGAGTTAAPRTPVGESATSKQPLLTENEPQREHPSPKLEPPKPTPNKLRKSARAGS